MLSRGFKEQIYDVFKFLPEKVRSSVVGRLVDFVDLDGLMRMGWMYRLARYCPSVEFGDWCGRAGPCTRVVGRYLLRVPPIAYPPPLIPPSYPPTPTMATTGAVRPLLGDHAPRGAGGDQQVHARPRAHPRQARRAHAGRWVRRL